MAQQKAQQSLILLRETDKRDNAGNIVVSKLNEDVLKEIAAKTNGVYVKLESSDEAVTKLKNQLSQIEKKAFGDMSMMNFRTYYCWFVGLMLVILVIENFISEKRSENSAKDNIRS